MMVKASNGMANGKTVTQYRCMKRRVDVSASSQHNQNRFLRAKRLIITGTNFPNQECRSVMVYGTHCPHPH